MMMMKSLFLKRSAASLKERLKTARKQKPKPEIPKRLCFHDENDLEANEQIQENEGFELNEQVQAGNPENEQELPKIKNIFVKPYQNEGYVI